LSWLGYASVCLILCTVNVFIYVSPHAKFMGGMAGGFLIGALAFGGFYYTGSTMALSLLMGATAFILAKGVLETFFGGENYPKRKKPGGEHRRRFGS
jgi:hypothetical protein